MKFDYKIVHHTWKMIPLYLVTSKKSFSAISSWTFAVYNCTSCQTMNLGLFSDWCYIWTYKIIYRV